VTLKDIASTLGVNASTVSRALDPRKAHLVSDETVTRVRETAKQLGYRGDRVAGALRRGLTGTIGVIVADLGNPFVTPVIHGIAQGLAPHEMLPLVVETNDDPSQLESCVDHLLSRRVDAVICAGSRFSNREVLEKAAEHTPVVIAVRGLQHTVLTQVLHDDRAGGAMAARHLLALGHSRLVELRGPDDVGNFVARHEGFREVCREAGATLVDLPTNGDRPIREEGERLALSLLDLHGDDLPTAVFAHNDLMAVGALGVFRQHGLSCPTDVSIVGYNNSPMIDQINPPLTSIAYPGTRVGRAAGDVALQLIADPGGLAPGAVFPPQLCLRDSTAGR
jgi:LacI family transcriptional regulator